MSCRCEAVGALLTLSPPQGVLNWHRFLEGPEGAENARFGSAIAALSDVNMDGFNDVIVGSPLEHQNAGAVYIYNGHGATVRTRFSQVSRRPRPQVHGHRPARLQRSPGAVHAALSSRDRSLLPGVIAELGQRALTAGCRKERTGKSLLSLEGTGEIR